MEADTSTITTAKLTKNNPMVWQRLRLELKTCDHERPDSV